MKSISLDNLELIIDNLIRRLREKGVKELSFEDMYWEVSTDDFISFHETPELLVGSIEDDIDFLNSLVQDDWDANFIELERLSALFKFMAKQYTV